MSKVCSARNSSSLVLVNYPCKIAANKSFYSGRVKSGKTIITRSPPPPPDSLSLPFDICLWHGLKRSRTQQKTKNITTRETGKVKRWFLSIITGHCHCFHLFLNATCCADNRKIDSNGDFKCNFENTNQTRILKSIQKMSQVQFSYLVFSIFC